MKQRFEKAVIETTDLQALLALGLLLCLRAWRSIPKVRPVQLVIPATISQIVALTLAALLPGNFIVIFLTGLFVVIGVYMFPMLRQPSKPIAHWVGANE